MTPEEILLDIESLKERMNADGKAALDRLKEYLAPYLVPQKPVEVIVEKIVEKPVVADRERRTEERDLGEKDQHLAEKMKFA